MSCGASYTNIPSGKSQCYRDNTNPVHNWSWLLGMTVWSFKKPIFSTILTSGGMGNQKGTKINQLSKIKENPNSKNQFESEQKNLKSSSKISNTRKKNLLFLILCQTNSQNQQIQRLIVKKANVNVCNFPSSSTISANTPIDQNKTYIIQPKQTKTDRNSTNWAHRSSEITESKKNLRILQQWRNYLQVESRWEFEDGSSSVVAAVRRDEKERASEGFLLWKLLTEFPVEIGTPGGGEREGREIREMEIKYWWETLAWLNFLF